MIFNTCLRLELNPNKRMLSIVINKLKCCQDNKNKITGTDQQLNSFK